MVLQGKLFSLDSIYWYKTNTNPGLNCLDPNPVPFASVCISLWLLLLSHGACLFISVKLSHAPPAAPSNHYTYALHGSNPYEKGSHHLVSNTIAFATE